VNAVAERLAEEFPDARIGALGYGAVSTPPSFKLQTNVVVFVCQDSAGYFDARYRENDARLLELWRAQAAHIGIYGYPGLISWVFPRYCAAELALQLAAARQAGATEFYGEDCWVEWIDADLPWITAQLLWNPWQDVAQLQERFRGAAFGPAAQAMGKYTAELRRLWEGAEQGVWFDGLFDLEQQARRYSEEDLAGLARLATATRRAAAGGSAYADRVEAVTQPMELARALAREIACAHSLRAAAAGAEQAETTARRRAALAEAVAERERLVAGLADRPWGESALRALQAQDTLNRWNRKLAGVAPDLAPPQEP
jgi:hypothetical protein